MKNTTERLLVVFWFFGSRPSTARSLRGEKETQKADSTDTPTLVTSRHVTFHRYFANLLGFCPRR